MFMDFEFLVKIILLEQEKERLQKTVKEESELRIALQGKLLKNLHYNNYLKTNKITNLLILPYIFNVCSYN